METKHTQGEWYYDINSNNGFDIFLKNSFKIIATVLHKNVSYMPNKIEAEANAKLIAAAPDLLEALIMVKDWAQEFGMGEEYYNKVINAIKKATNGN